MVGHSGSVAKISVGLTGCGRCGNGWIGMYRGAQSRGISWGGTKSANDKRAKQFCKVAYIQASS